MKKFFKKYKHTTALAAVLFAAFAMCAIHLYATAVLFVGLWQLSQFAMSKRIRGVCYIGATLTHEQIDEFSDILRELSADFPKLKGLPDKLRLLEQSNDEMRNEIRKMRKAGLGGSGTGVRWIGGVPFVTDDCAQALTSIFVLDCSRIKGALESIVPDESARTRVLAYASGVLGIQQRAGGALGTGDIPLPTIYMPQIVELVFAYGAARKYATLFPPRRRHREAAALAGR